MGRFASSGGAFSSAQGTGSTSDSKEAQTISRIEERIRGLGQRNKANVLPALVAEKYKKGKLKNSTDYPTECNKEYCKPLDSWYKDNAVKYGYEYTFIPFKGVKKC